VLYSRTQDRLGGWLKELKEVFKVQAAAIEAVGG
jgi:hypothetical protein